MLILWRDSFVSQVCCCLLSAGCPMVRVSQPRAGPSSSPGRAEWWLQEKRFLLHLTPGPHSGCRGDAGASSVCWWLLGTKLGWGLGAPGKMQLLIQQCLWQCLWSLVQLHHWCFILPTGSAFLLLAPCHNTGSPSPPVQGQGLPSSSALPASPRACLPMAPGGLQKAFSLFSFLCAASPWAHAPAGPPTMLLPPALLCCLMPSCLHLVGPSPAREGSEHKRGGRSLISLCDPSRAALHLPGGALSELPHAPLCEHLPGESSGMNSPWQEQNFLREECRDKFLCSPGLCQAP